MGGRILDWFSRKFTCIDFQCYKLSRVEIEDMHGTVKVLQRMQEFQESLHKEKLVLPGID